MLRRKSEVFVLGNFVAFGGICGEKLGFLGLSSEEEHGGCMCMGAWRNATRTRDHYMGPSPIHRWSWALRLVHFRRQGLGLQDLVSLPGWNPVNLTSKSVRTLHEHPDLRNKAESQKSILSPSLPWYSMCLGCIHVCVSCLPSFGFQYNHSFILYGIPNPASK